MAPVPVVGPAHPPRSGVRRFPRLCAWVAVVCIATAAVVAPPGPAESRLGIFSADGPGAGPMTLTVAALPLADRYDELRPLLNHRAAQLHWVTQFLPVPGNVRFHTWAFYTHVVDPVVASAVRNAANVIDGAASVDTALERLAVDTRAALRDFVATELSGHTNVVPPDSDANGAVTPWLYWAIEVATAPLYYLPVPSALIVQVPIVARFAVDVAAGIAENLSAVLHGTRTPHDALRNLAEVVQTEAVPRLIAAERAVFTPPPPPDTPSNRPPDDDSLPAPLPAPAPATKSAAALRVDDPTGPRRHPRGIRPRPSRSHPSGPPVSDRGGTQPDQTAQTVPRGVHRPPRWHRADLGAGIGGGVGTGGAPAPTPDTGPAGDPG